MKKYLIVFLFGCTFFSSFANAETAKDRAILAEIRQLAPLLTDGAAELYEEGVIIQYSSCMAQQIQAKEIAIVLFFMNSFGAGNNGHQFMAIFRHDIEEEKDDRYVFHEWRLYGLTEVGGTHYRYFTKIVCDKDVITLSGEEEVEEDYKKVNVKFRFEPYLIQELLLL